MKFLRQGKCSPAQFFMACTLPLVVIGYWLTRSIFFFLRHICLKCYLVQMKNKNQLSNNSKGRNSGSEMGKDVPLEQITYKRNEALTKQVANTPEIEVTDPDGNSDIEVDKTVSVVENKEKYGGGISSPTETDMNASSDDCNTLEPDATSEIAQVILSSLEGPYKTYGTTRYWVSIMELRRLLLTLTLFCPYVIMQISLALFLSLAFLVHHIYVQPFLTTCSNQAETVSLFFLCLIAGFNAFKASYSQSGMLVKGPAQDLLLIFDTMEHALLLFLIAIIVLIHMLFMMKRRFK